MPVWISLLRAINVGGSKTIKMDALKAFYEGIGLSGAQTLLQSGNVVFYSEHADAGQLAHFIEGKLEQHAGFRTAIVVRSLDDMRDIYRNNPFPADQAADPSKLVVMFLASAADETACATLIQAYQGPERIIPGKQALYLYYPDGLGRSKLTNDFMEKKLQTVGTVRNWNTIGKLITLGEKLVTG